MEELTRKTMLYKTGVEYGDYAMNHVQGCSHGCSYPCYAYLMAHRYRRVGSVGEWTEPKLVSNTLDILDRELAVCRRDPIRNVHLCFSTDPFMVGYEEVRSMSMAAIERINGAGVPVTVLTKGLLPLGLSRFDRRNRYGVTIVSLSEEFRRKYERGAAPARQRLARLRLLHDVGCRTWVSIEPYPTPNIVEQDLRDLLEEVKFAAASIVFGRMNYSPEANKYRDSERFYARCVDQISEFCEENDIGLRIKKGTE